MSNGQQPPLPRIAIARICYGGFHHAGIADWLAHTCHKIVTSPERFSGLESFWIDKHNVCMARNHAVQVARARNCQYLVMVDADMVPDCIPGAAPFWDTSIATALQLNVPCVISAPCEKGDGTVVVYREVLDRATGKIHLDFVERQYAATATGMTRVPAASLALSLIDLRCCDLLSPPYFSFGYTDETESDLAWGEEEFTVRLHEKGVHILCNWLSWCGHDKKQLRTKPIATEIQPKFKKPELWVP